MILKTSTQKKSIVQALFVGIFFICLASISMIAILWIMSDIKQNKSQIKYEIEREELFQKQILKEQVTEVIQYIEYMKTLTKKRLEQSIKQRTLEAHDIARNLYSEYKDTLPDATIQKMIRDVLRPIRFNNGRGYYFATSMKGIEILFADRPQLEGKNMLNMQDAKGQYVIKDMIKLARAKNQGFYEYFWTKPGSDNERIHKKIAFVKHFAPYDWFIGTGEYLVDVEQEIQKEVIKRIETMKFSKTGYVFAGTIEGLSLSGPAKGKNMIAVTDVNGIKIVQELIRTAKASGGYVEYELPPFKGYLVHRKISYAMAVPEWGWYVGAGLDVESFDLLAQGKKAELAERIRDNITKTLFSLAMLIIIIIAAIIMISRQISSTLKTFESFFQNAAFKKKKINIQNIHFAEFLTLASSANQMISQINESESKIMENQRMLIQTEKMMSMGGLAAGMAHEINNPLGIILGAVQNAQRRLDPEMKKNVDIAAEMGLDLKKLELYLEQRSILFYLTSIRTASERAAGIVKKMLGFSRKSESNKSIQDISILIDTALDIAGNDYDLKKKYDFRSFEITRDYEPGLSIFCTETEIMQVILNIVTNAAHAMTDKDRSIKDRPRIIVRTRDKGTSCIIEIIDNGPGLDRKSQDKIFEPFYTTKAPGQGTGLGLSVSYFIIANNHNGSLKVESEPERGARFIIELPKN